jgi:uncharacterized protein (DUF302 family)
MSDDNALKSSFELAMERLKKKDADAGVVRAPVTDAQKAAMHAQRKRVKPSNIVMSRSISSQ